MLLPFLARVAGPTVTDYVTQALATFGANSSASTPRSTGTTACDTVGLALMGRKVAHGKASTAGAIPETALAENLARDEAIIQNIDKSGGILRVWLADQPTVKFELAPGQPFTWRGGDELKVDTASGTAAYVAVDR